MTIDYILVFRATKYANEMKGLLSAIYSIIVIKLVSKLNG